MFDNQGYPMIKEAMRQVKTQFEPTTEPSQPPAQNTQTYNYDFDKTEAKPSFFTRLFGGPTRAENV